SSPHDGFAVLTSNRCKRSPFMCRHTELIDRLWETHSRDERQQSKHRHRQNNFGFHWILLASLGACFIAPLLMNVARASISASFSLRFGISAGLMLGSARNFLR